MIRAVAVESEGKGLNMHGKSHSPQRFASRGQATVVAVVAALAVIAGTAGPAHAADTVPGLNSTLTGTLTAISGTCDPAGTSTIRFTATGVVTGNYPGTFTETGVITIGPAQEFPEIDVWHAGPVMTFDADFTIDSPAGAVGGTKHQVFTRFEPGAFVTFGFCATFTNLPFFFGSVISGEFYLVCMCGSLPLPLEYVATITTPEGRFHDEGSSGGVFEYTRTELVSGTYNRTQQNIFQEFLFTSGEAVRIGPAQASDCKDGGWETYSAPAFKNQGDCVSFVVSKRGAEEG